MAMIQIAGPGWRYSTVKHELDDIIYYNFLLAPKKLCVSQTG